MCPLIDIFGREIGTYGLCAVIGCIVSVYFFYRNTKSYGLIFEDVVLLAVPTFLGLVIGGHIVFGFTHIDVMIKLIRNIGKLSFNEIIGVLSACFGGSVFYGGFLGSLITFVIFTRKYPEEMKQKFRDTFALCIPLFHVFGRIGCFLGGCCYGIESEFGFTVHNNTLVPEINDVCRFPTPLLESFGNLVIFLILFAIYKKNRMNGKLVFLYIIIYPCLRFSDEFLRGDTIRGIYFGLSTSQWISIILFITAVSYFIISKIRKPKTE